MHSLRVDVPVVAGDAGASWRGRVGILVLVTAAIILALVIQWRVVRNSPPPAERAADTLCIAARIGLPCRD